LLSVIQIILAIENRPRIDFTAGVQKQEYFYSLNGAFSKIPFPEIKIRLRKTKNIILKTVCSVHLIKRIF
jgi:hypothetical protein